MKIPSKVILNSLDDLSEGMLKENGNMKLVIDIMYIKKIPFIITTSRAIHFGTIQMIKDIKRETFIKSLQQVTNTCENNIMRRMVVSMNSNSILFLGQYLYLSISRHYIFHGYSSPFRDAYIGRNSIAAQHGVTYFFE